MSFTFHYLATDLFFLSLRTINPQCVWDLGFVFLFSEIYLFSWVISVTLLGLIHGKQALGHTAVTQPHAYIFITITIFHLQDFIAQTKVYTIKQYICSSTFVQPLVIFNLLFDPMNLTRYLGISYEWTHAIFMRPYFSFFV